MHKGGCKPGFIEWGSQCVKHEFPAIGTNIAPSVENRAGCNRINSYWNEEYGVCVYCDDYKGTVGWTAPIKGVYVKWQRGPHAVFSRLFDAFEKSHGVDSITELPEKALTDIGEEANNYAEITVCPVYADPWYFRSRDMISGCSTPVYKKILHTSDARKKGLELASAIAHGHGQQYGLYYYNEKGLRVSSTDKHAICSDEPNKIKELYEKYNLQRQEPFSIRAGLKR